MSDLGLALWNTPISKVTMTKEDLRKFLLEHRRKIIANGRLRNIKSKSIGVGIYEVWTEKTKYDENTKDDSNVAGLARAVGTLSSVVDGLCDRIETLENEEAK